MTVAELIRKLELHAQDGVVRIDAPFLMGAYGISLEEEFELTNVFSYEKEITLFLSKKAGESC